VKMSIAWPAITVLVSGALVAAPRVLGGTVWIGPDRSGESGAGSTSSRGGRRAARVVRGLQQ